jgi:uncharacterized protein YdhG (YjbR/CyaY superfamily)
MTVIDDYLDKCSGLEKLEIEKIRLIVNKEVPEAQEVITYGMPGFKYKGKYLLAFNIFKDHIGLFPTAGPIDALKDKLTDFKTSKGGIQFTPQKPIPESLIKEILFARIAQIQHK